MLRIPSKPATVTNLSQTVLRHKVRNLRAKVKLLLPVNMCCKYDKRNKVIQKIESNRLGWAHCHEGGIFIDDHDNKTQHLFYKLTTEQIEQIKEDKLYYLGQEHIHHFNDYLQNKEQKLNKNKYTHQNKQNRDIAMTHKTSYSECHQFQPSFIDEPKPKWKELNTQNNDHSPQKQQTKLKQSLKWKQIYNRKHEIIQQQLTKRILTKLQRNQKMEKYFANRQIQTMKKQAIIRQINRKHELKSANSPSQQQKWRQIAQVSEMSERLRAVCLTRFSKSANLQLRSTP